MMHLFMTGATGYIGGSVAAKLIASGHRVRGLTRTADGAAKLEAAGIEPVIGSLVDGGVLAQAARAADAVIHTANSDDASSVEALLPALAGSGKRLIQTSGSSIIGDRAAGEPSDRVFHEDSVYEPLPERAGRLAIDRKVLAAAHDGVHSIVIRPTLIYGRGHGAHKDSVQVPKMIAVAKKHGVPRHVGRGLNIWSHVHIDDVVDLYLLALERAPAGSLFYVENGECAMRTITEAIGRVQGNRPPEDWPVNEAFAELGAAAYTSYGSNSRVRAAKARAMLGWQPKGPPLIEEIERGCYREEIRGGAPSPV
jgi:nucleoside-diphosphate-sugar epimerase